MKLSVIIPVYNCAQYLERCLDSVLSQRLDAGDELQIITVDDGSTDGSDAILDRYANQNSNIQVIHQTNQGVSAARNHALDMAEGDYIHFMDSDDFLLYDNCYKVLLDILKQATTPIDILRFNMVRFFESNEVIKKRFYNLDNIKVEFDGSGLQLCKEIDFVGYACTSLSRRCLIEELNLRFNTNIAISEDTVFNLELNRQASRVIIINANIYGYFLNSGSATFNIDKKRLKSAIDNLFVTIPVMVGVLDKYNNPELKAGKIAFFGKSIAKRLLNSNLSWKQTRDYIKKGFYYGYFPIGGSSIGKYTRFLNWLLKRPVLFWLMSFPFRYIFLKMIKPRLLRNG